MKEARAKKPRTKMNREELRKDVLEALGSYQRRGSLPTDTATIAELLKGESDRGKVIILGSFVEDAILERVLAKFGKLSNAQRKNLTRSGAPLSSFAAITNVAEAFGLLDEYEIGVLEVVKAMRNACAHSRLEINFNTPELQDAAKLLISDFFTFDQDGVPHPVPREVFDAIFLFAAGALTDPNPPQGSRHFTKVAEIFRKMHDVQPASPRIQIELSKRGARRNPKAIKPPPPPQS